MNSLKKKSLVIAYLIFTIVWAIETIPKNPFIEHYEVVPPLGFIKSIATSHQQIFVVSDNYLLILNKTDLKLQKTTCFSEYIEFVAYDHLFDELWLTSYSSLIRYNPNLGSIREYPIGIPINGIGIGANSVYLDGPRKYALNRLSGEFKEINDFPKDIRWFKKTQQRDIEAYRFLSPYYFLDPLDTSPEPFTQYRITTVFDDGLYLYVGTENYGLLRYNKYSWNKERLVYGPLDTKIKMMRRINNTCYLLSSSGISFYNREDKTWRYVRLNQDARDFIFLDNRLILAVGSQLLSLSGTFVAPVGQLPALVLSLNSDEKYLYIGTNSGMFRMIKGTDAFLQFGPDKFAIYTIYTTPQNIYVGGEFAFYDYNKTTHRWEERLNRGIKDIIETEKSLYLLTTNNQLVSYQKNQSQENDTNWLLLPYFNIYDIETDGKVVYCATFAGLNLYDPATELYQPIYELPRIKYDYIILTDEEILALSEERIYRLPLKYLNW
ncbi:MAG: hypothetical protein ABIL70_05355 [candidate division WOR-3 bacterium]